jgi:hypothetical protein
MEIEELQKKDKDKESKESELQEWNPNLLDNNDNDAYSLFLYGVRSRVTRDYYLRRLPIFLNYIKLLPEETMEKRCNFFALKAKKDPVWVFNCIIQFLRFQREKVERMEIVGATLKNFIKPHK